MPIFSSMLKRALGVGRQSTVTSCKFISTGATLTGRYFNRSKASALFFLTASVTTCVFATTAHCDWQADNSTIYGTPISEVEEYIDEVFDPYKKYEHSEDSNEVLSSRKTVLVIEWTINDNVVVYQARVKDGALDDKKPLKAFWLELDQSFVRNARRKGKMNDRRKLDGWEQRFTFGTETRLSSPGVHSVKIIWTKKMNLSLTLDDNGDPVLLGDINGDRCIMKKFYVVCINKASFQRIEISGVSVATGEERRTVIVT